MIQAIKMRLSRVFALVIISQCRCEVCGMSNLLEKCAWHLVFDRRGRLWDAFRLGHLLLFRHVDLICSRRCTEKRITMCWVGYMRTQKVDAINEAREHGKASGSYRTQTRDYVSPGSTCGSSREVMSLQVSRPSGQATCLLILQPLLSPSSVAEASRHDALSDGFQMV